MELNLAPLVDVMMCLLIFFLLATKMVERESVHIDLPTAAAARDLERKALGTRVVVNVVETNGQAEYIVDGQALGLPALAERLAIESSRNPDVTCYLRADRDVAYERVEAVLVECARRKITNVTFAAAPSTGG